MAVRILLTLLVLLFTLTLNAQDSQNKELKNIAKQFSLIEEEYLSSFNHLSFAIHPPHPFALITIPKSGTHLAIKLLSMMTAKVAVGEEDDENTCYEVAHYWNKEKIRELCEKKNLRFIVMCRDPRDIATSSIHYFKAWPSKSDNVINQKMNKVWGKATINEKLSLTIGHPDSYLKPSLEWLLSFAQMPRVYLCRFESLIGREGGGSLEKQKEEILNVAEFLNIQLSQEQLDFLCTNLYGKTATFRKGKIGSWRTSFREEHKRLFKETMNEYLVQLGYESNNSW